MPELPFRRDPELVEACARRLRRLDVSPPLVPLPMVTGGWVPAGSADASAPLDAVPGSGAGDPASAAPEQTEPVRRADFTSPAQPPHADEERWVGADRPDRRTDSTVEGSSSGVLSLSGRLSELLPETLRGGLVDPGRAGLIGLVVVALIAAVIAASLLLRSRPSEIPVTTTVDRPAAAASPAPAELVIDVAGEVAHPGVVRLPDGARVADALAAAGGTMPGTDTSALNLARPLKDGEQVLVGASVALPPGAAGQAGSSQLPDGRLDLNTADASDLEDLPGVGPVLAQRILDWRSEHGKFDSVDQLQEVSGIGAATYGDLKDQVGV